MMAPRRLVVVHDAEALLTPGGPGTTTAPTPPPKRRGRGASTPAEEFEAYLSGPSRLTTLVLETAGSTVAGG